jgi:hypothetical protein
MKIPLSTLNRLTTQHLSLSTIIEGLDEEHFFYKPLPEKWSIKDNIAHLARYQRVFLDRLDKILTTDSPVFKAYRAENDPEFDKWMQKDLIVLLKELKDDRNIIVRRITGFGQKDLQRVGMHPKFGKLKVLDWAEFFLLHEAHHLFTVFQLAHSKK